ncbi:MAG: zinc D-Ala-D-Ala carboxypeptidase [Candidatus Sumerlaeota bacterium]|nr:zinc D-Ala-D-Ala carboxypeptidase [Candidatus Sumerlaeota bacterium]
MTKPKGMDAGPADIPWIAFTDACIARVEPRTDAPVVRRLAKGDTVIGDYFVDPQTDEEWVLATIDGERAYVPRWNLCRIHPGNHVTENLPYGTEIVNRWWGLPIDYEPDDLEIVPKEYCDSDPKEYPLRAEALDALLALLDAARAEDLDIRVGSAYRSGIYQVGLYTRAIDRDGPSQRYSAPPGHSEHQLGTCVDLLDAEEKFVLVDEFKTTPHSAWLESNASRFGFRRSYYPENVADTGYISEPWHWRYWGR